MRRLREHAELELAGRPEVREVVLIGSLARDDWSARSDADLVVVVDAAPHAEPLRGPDYAPTDPFPVPVDVLLFTADGARRWTPRFRTEVESGIRLYRR